MYDNLKSLCVICAVLVSVVVGDAYAKTDAEIETAISERLTERHPTDTQQWWLGLGATAPKIIIVMYEKTTVVYHRVRLLEGLAWFKEDAKALEFLKQQAEKADNQAIRNTALRGVGKSQGAKEVEFVSKFLIHTEQQTRLTAAEALKTMNDPKAKAVYEKYLAEEKTPWIVQKLKGDLSVPVQKLNPVATSEDRISKEFIGEWRGYWIMPKTGTRGLKLEQAILRFVSQEKAELLIAQKTGKKSKAQQVINTAVLEKIEGRGLKIDGTLTIGSQQIPFEAELSDQAGALILELHARKIAATLIVRKEIVQK